MSLRIKVLVAAIIAITLPLVGYLVLDSTLNRSQLLEDQATSLRLVADSMNARFMSCFNECDEAIQLFVETMGKVHPEIDTIIVGPALNVIAATSKNLIGQKWEEPQFADVLAGRSVFEWNNMEHQGTPVLDVTVPMYDRYGTIAGVIHLAKHADLVSERVFEARIRHGIFVLFVIVMVVSILGFILYRNVIRRLLRIDREIRNIGGYSTNDVGPAVKGDEIDRLHAFLEDLVRRLSGTATNLKQALKEKESLLGRVNELNANLESEIDKTRKELQKAQEELIRTEHLSTIGKLSAGLAHEIRNPLFIIRASAESITRSGSDREALSRDIIEEVDRVNRMITRLLELARPLQVDKVLLNLNDLTTEVAEYYERALPPGVEISAGQIKGQGSTVICGDATLLRQALFNMVENSIQAIPGKGSIRLVVHPGPMPCIEVIDNGRGIESADLNQIFDPFFSKRSGGTGLGLASVKKIMDLHGAEISVESTPSSGTVFRIRFNRHPEDCDGQNPGY